MMLTTVLMAQAGDSPTDTVARPHHGVLSYLDLDINIANNHLWRGIEVSDGLVVTSSLAVHDPKEYVKAGVWSGTNTSGDYKELNFFVQFAVQRFRLEFWDTYNFSPGADYNNHEFFNYNARTTGRFLDCIASYKVSERFPLTLTWSTILFGRDRYNLYSADSKQRYSTYVAAGYRCFDRQQLTIDAAAGGTFTLNNYKGDRSTFYSSRPGVIDLRVTATYNLRITDSYSLPLSATVMCNPVEDRAYFQLSAKVLSL